VSALLQDYVRRGFVLPGHAVTGEDYILDRSIHDTEAIRFSAEVLRMPAYLLDILKNGYMPKFSRAVTRYTEKNNRSALDNPDFVREKIKNWLAAGFAEELSVPAYCNNPLSVAEKYDPVQDSVKLRPVLDLSRHVNEFVTEQLIQLDDLSRTEFLLEPEDFLVVFDLKNQFCHVRLHPEAKKYFGFSFENEEGTLKHYQFTVMIYGFKTAVAVMTKLLTPVKAYLHKLGIRNSIYVDDGKSYGASVVETFWKQVVVLTVVQLSGWSVQWEKNGFQTCAKTMSSRCNHRHGANEIHCGPRKSHSTTGFAPDGSERR